MFFADNRDHQLIEQAIRDKLYDTGKRPTAFDRSDGGRVDVSGLKRQSADGYSTAGNVGGLAAGGSWKNRVNDLSPLEQLPMLNAVYMRNNSGLTLAEVRRAGRVMRQCIIVHNLK